MRVFTITVGGPSGFDVADEYGRICNGLAFDEMLGQVVSLCHPELSRPHYAMNTEAEWEQMYADRRARIASDNDVTRDPPFAF